MKEKYSSLQKSLLDKEKELLKQAENELEKENQAMKENQNMEKKLMDFESKFIQSEIENQKLSNKIEEFNEIKDAIEIDKVSLFF